MISAPRSGAAIAPTNATRRAGRERGCGVTDDGERVGAVDADLRTVDVDVHDRRSGRERVADEVRADGEDDVGVVEQRLQTLVHPHGARVERVAVVEAALALTGGDHRRLQELGELGQLGGGVAQDHATARPDHGRSAPTRTSAARAISSGSAASRTLSAAAHSVMSACFGERLRRHLDLHRLPATALDAHERLVHGVGDLVARAAPGAATR